MIQVSNHGGTPTVFRGPELKKFIFVLSLSHLNSWAEQTHPSNQRRPRSSPTSLPPCTFFSPLLYTHTYTDEELLPESPAQVFRELSVRLQGGRGRAPLFFSLERTHGHTHVFDFFLLMTMIMAAPASERSRDGGRRRRRRGQWSSSAGWRGVSLIASSLAGAAAQEDEGDGAVSVDESGGEPSTNSNIAKAVEVRNFTPSVRSSVVNPSRFRWVDCSQMHAPLDRPSNMFPRDTADVCRSS